jgi:dihydroxy-acid dehydratase
MAKQDVSAGKMPNAGSGGVADVLGSGISIYMCGACAKSMGYSGDEPAAWWWALLSRLQAQPRHRHFPELLDAVKRGVTAAGGLALEFLTISLHESTPRRTHEVPQPDGDGYRGDPRPAHGCRVLMGGCDKIAPAQLMGRRARASPPYNLSAGRR